MVQSIESTLYNHFFQNHDPQYFVSDECLLRDISNCLLNTKNHTVLLEFITELPEINGIFSTFKTSYNDFNEERTIKNIYIVFKAVEYMCLSEKAICFPPPYKDTELFDELLDSYYREKSYLKSMDFKELSLLLVHILDVSESLNHFQRKENIQLVTTYKAKERVTDGKWKNLMTAKGIMKRQIEEMIPKGIYHNEMTDFIIQNGLHKYLTSTGLPVQLKRRTLLRFVKEVLKEKGCTHLILGRLHNRV